MPIPRKLLCVIYGVISLVALFATWSQNIPFLIQHSPVEWLSVMAEQLRASYSSRSFTVDILLFALAACVLMVIEAKKHGIKYVWLYILGGFAIAISVTFPLFLIAREMRLNSSEQRRLGTIDTVLLAVIAVITAGAVVWIDVA